MELAAHWHRCQNLPKKRVNTSLLYRERNDPVKDGLANWQGLCVLFLLLLSARLRAFQENMGGSASFEGNG